MTEEQFYSRLRKQYFNKLPFALHNSSSAPGLITALLQENEELFYTEAYTESGFVFAPFDDKKQTILIPENVSEKISLQKLEIPTAAEEAINAKEEGLENNRTDHVKLVQKAVEVLSGGTMEKVVLSRREEVFLNEQDPIKLFQDLLQSYPKAFVYCWYHPKVGLWLGATPETLLKITGNQFETMALAGTQKFTGNPDVDWGEKEKQEQKFVTDSILESLRTNRIGRIETSGPYTAKAGSLLHLRTDIRGRLIQDFGRVDQHEVSTASKEIGNEKEASHQTAPSSYLKKIISALHPTPAVCGLPKEKAKMFILKNERYDREFYAGFLGVLNQQQVMQRSRSRRNIENLAYRAVKQETSLFVNLRCMKIEAGKAFIFVGGGITKESIPEDEWQETVHKAQTMKKVLLK